MAENMIHHLPYEVERHHDFINDGRLWNLYQNDRPITPLLGEVPTTGPSGLVRLEDYVYFIKDGSLQSFRIDGPRQPDETERMELPPSYRGSQVILGLVPHVDYVFVWTADAIFRFGRSRRLSKIQISERDPAGRVFQATHDLTIRKVAALAGLPNRVELLIHSTSNKVYKALVMPPGVLVREVLFEDDGELIGGFRNTMVMMSSEEGQQTFLKLFEGSKFTKKVRLAMRVGEGSKAFLDDYCVHVINPEDGRIESMNVLDENLRWTTPEASVLVRGGWDISGETGGPRPHWHMGR